MWRCEGDEDLGLVLVSDPRVSCELSVFRTATLVHAAAVLVAVGAGLPFFIGWKMIQLRREDKLTADSIYAGLFEWYALERPYWEVRRATRRGKKQYPCPSPSHPLRSFAQAVLLFKKFVLVLAANTVITNPTAQASIGFAVHLLYLVLLETKKPMPFRPSTSAYFKGQNFFHLLERSSSVASIIGSLLAILGSTNRSAMTTIGSVFAAVNLVYVAAVIYAFAGSPSVSFSSSSSDAAPKSSKITPTLGSGAKSAIATQGSHWGEQFDLVGYAKDLSPLVLTQISRELLLLRSRTVLEMEKELRAAKTEGAVETAFKEGEELVARLNADTAKLPGEVEPCKAPKQLVPDVWVGHLQATKRWTEAAAFLQVRASDNTVEARLD